MLGLEAAIERYGSEDFPLIYIKYQFFFQITPKRASVTAPYPDGVTCVRNYTARVQKAPCGVKLNGGSKCSGS
ncbi:hypothetical protein O3P69_005050 [Scylla paramamosain]|uniref:Uncharacterized protein n=1 Tax=Scylla paramamosain TaxID=85552 RepID=A0AAW0UC82_SCYPA